MIQVLAATLMWGLVLCLLPGIRRRADHSIVVAAVTIAAALTLNVDRVYSAGDALLGGRNVLDLGANILMVVGIYFLSRGILRAADPEDVPSGHERLGIAVLGLVIAGLIVCFSLIAGERFFGLVGALFAVPIAAVFVACFDYARVKAQPAHSQPALPPAP